MRNKIVRNMLIFLSALAMVTAVPFTTTTSVFADDGNSSGGGDGGNGTGSGTNSAEYRSKYKKNDGGYRIFLIPSFKHMNYDKDIQNGGEVHFKDGDTFTNNEDWIMFSKQRKSKNLAQAQEYYKKVHFYARLGAYEIHTHDIMTGGSSFRTINAYYAKPKYLSCYPSSVRSLMMGNDLDRVMNFSGIFGSGTPNLMNMDTWTYNFDKNTSGTLTNWGDKLFLKDKLADYEQRVQQMKNWMKKKKNVYAEYGSKFVDYYNEIMSTPNSKLDIVLEPVYLIHDRNGDHSHVVVYSYTDALMTTKNGQGFGVKNTHAAGNDVSNRDYTKDFGTRDIPNAFRAFDVWDDFNFKKPNQKSYVRPHASKYHTTLSYVWGWIGGGIDAYRVGFVHYTPWIYEEANVAQMGVSHNIVIIDKSDVVGTKGSSGTSTVAVNPEDIVVSYGTGTTASTLETRKNSESAGSPAYNKFNTVTRLDDWDEINNTSTASVKGSNGKKVTLNAATFQRLVYSIWGPRYSDALGVFATNKNKPQYDADIDKVGGIAFKGSTEKTKSRANLWHYGTNESITPVHYGDFMYAGAAGLQLDEWMEITKDNTYDITEVSTAKIKHSGLDSESRGYQYYALTVGTESSNGYMARYLRKEMRANFQKTAKRVPLSGSDGTNVLGAKYTNTLRYKDTKMALAGAFGTAIINKRQEYAGDNYPDIKKDTTSISYLAKSLTPSSSASKKMSSNDDTAKSYKRNFLYNLWGLTAASSDMKVQKKESGTLITVQKNSNSFETISVAVLQKKKTVTSYMAFARLEVTKSSKTDRVGTYSLAQTGSGAYRKYNVASNGKFNVDPKSGMGSVMSGSSKDKTYHYLVSWQNNQTPSSASYDFSKSSRASVAQAIGNALTSYANSHNGLGQGNSDSVMN